MDNLNAPEMSSWRSEGEALAIQHKGHQWRIADWLCKGIDSLPAPAVYDTAEKLFPQYSRAILRNFAAVARAYPASFRNDALTFTHHVAVMSEQWESFRPGWLQQAAEGGWSVAKLRFEIDHSLEMREAAKAEEKESEKEEESTEPAAPPKAKSKPRPAFTLANLRPSYRTKLEKLAVARRMPVDLLATAIIEAALDEAVEEIAVVEEKWAEVSGRQCDEMKRTNAERQQRKAEELAAQHGGSAADYLAAHREYHDYHAMALECHDRRTRGQRATFTCFTPWQYAAWRVVRMEEEAWNENEARDIMAACPDVEEVVA